MYIYYNGRQGKELLNPMCWIKENSIPMKWKKKFNMRKQE